MLRHALDQHFHRALAAEAETEDQILVMARVIGHEGGSAAFEYGSGTLGEVGFEAAAETSPLTSRAIGTEEHSCARPPIGRAHHADDGGQRAMAAPRAQRRKGSQQVTTIAHGLGASAASAREAEDVQQRTPDELHEGAERARRHGLDGCRRIRCGRRPPGPSARRPRRTAPPFPWWRRRSCVGRAARSGRRC